MRRHDLVYLRPGASFAFVCGQGEPALAAVRGWIDRGRPLVVARQPAKTEGVVLGLALPPALNRWRVACRVEHSAIARIAPPLAVRACLDRLPADTAAVLAGLEACLLRAGIRVGVYGSLAWESLSGEAYRHPASDIDLICDLATHSQHRVALAALAAAAGKLPCRLDGEIRFPDGNAAAWRELADCRDKESATILAKGPEDVTLLSMQALLASLLPERRHA